MVMGLLLAWVCAASFVEDDSVQQRLDARVREWVQPNVVVAVRFEGESAIAATRGRLSADSPVRIASLAKGMIAYAVLSQVDDPEALRRTSLAAFDFGPQFDEVQVGQLLENSSGVPDYGVILGLRGEGYSEAPSEAEVDRLVQETLHPTIEPGSWYHYSNSNFLLLWHLLGQLSGKPASEALRECLFDPRGLDDTRVLSEAEARVEARGGVAPRSPELRLVSTAEDLLRWMELVLEEPGFEPQGRALFRDGFEVHHFASQAPVLTIGAGLGASHPIQHSLWIDREHRLAVLVLSRSRVWGMSRAFGGSTPAGMVQQVVQSFLPDRPSQTGEPAFELGGPEDGERARVFASEDGQLAFRLMDGPGRRRLFPGGWLRPTDRPAVYRLQGGPLRGAELTLGSEGSSMQLRWGAFPVRQLVERNSVEAGAVVDASRWAGEYAGEFGGVLRIRASDQSFPGVVATFGRAPSELFAMTDDQCTSMEGLRLLLRVEPDGRRVVTVHDAVGFPLQSFRESGKD